MPAFRGLIRNVRLGHGLFQQLRKEREDRVSECMKSVCVGRGRGGGGGSWKSNISNFSERQPIFAPFRKITRIGNPLCEKQPYSRGE